MATTSPQAIGIPNFASLGDELRQLNRARPAIINEPRVITLTGNSDLVYDSRANNAFGDRQVVTKLMLHNLGANPMYYAINQDASAAKFHDILAGGSAALDGLGSQVDLSREQPQYVSVKGTAGEKVAVIIAYPIDQPIAS